MSTNLIFGTIALLMAFISGIAAGALAKNPGSLSNIAEESVEVVERALDDIRLNDDSEDEFEYEDRRDENDSDDEERQGRDDGRSSPSVSGSSGASVGSAPSQISKASFTSAEVAQHNTEKSCYVIISGVVYDLTAFLEKHPGGFARVRPLCGTDGTKAFTEKHEGNEKPAQVLLGLEIGVLK